MEFEAQREELIIRLRELFLEYEDFEMRKRVVAKGQLWKSSKPQKLSELIDSTPEEILLEQQAFNLRISENQLSLSLAKILGSYDFKWELVQEGCRNFTMRETFGLEAQGQGRSLAQAKASGQLGVSQAQ